MKLYKKDITLVLHRQIVEANIPKSDTARAQHVEDTLKFLAANFRQEALPAAEVKKLTLLRAANGHQDLQVIPTSKVPSAEQLAEAMERFPVVQESFVLKHDDVLDMTPAPAMSLD